MVARKGEHVIDQQAITVANQQACMILCALEAASELQRFRAGCLLLQHPSISDIHLFSSQTISRCIAHIDGSPFFVVRWFACPGDQDWNAEPLSLVIGSCCIYIYDFTKFVRVYVKYLQLGKR